MCSNPTSPDLQITHFTPVLCQLPSLQAFMLYESLDITSINSLSPAFPEAPSLRMPYFCVRYQEQECGAERISRCNLTRHAQLFLYQQQKEYVVCAFPGTLPLAKSRICICVLPDVLITNVVFISITRNLCVCVSRLSLRVASVFYTRCRWELYELFEVLSIGMLCYMYY